MDASDQYQQALQAFRAKNLSVAESIAKDMLAAAPTLVNGWRLLADIQVARGRTHDAVVTLETAWDAAQYSQKSWTSTGLHLARTLISMGKEGRAKCILLALKPAELTHPEPLAQAAYLYSLCEEHEKSLELYERALELRPESVELLFNCAAANRSMGKLSRSELLYDCLIALNPLDAEAYKNRSDLRRQTAASNHVEELQQALSAIGDQAAPGSQLNFALAKELEDLERYEESFVALEEACRLRRSIIRYFPEKDLARVDEISLVFSPEVFSGLQSKYANTDLGREVIFVLGMPRTGTTLVDRVLCASGKVLSAGEPGIFSRLVAELSQSAASTEPGDISMISAASKIDFELLGRRYLQELHERVPKKSSDFILDKNPMNFLYVGLIRLALPGARIVHLCRNPMDTCYAVYKTQFRNAYPFSYDQVEMANYYMKYRELMGYWRTLEGVEFLDLNYEDLVDQFDAQTQRLYEFCGLDWSTDVQQFYLNGRQGTSTASASQVRQPVYRSSVGKWKRFERQLQPMWDRLAKAGL
ncbi:tetratricopeptide repeat-containing sulfotransferase family protein [Microbulbifer mangrovi]|uniref:tetratricopeptide repeat-containing sulfotransferase family protein n=1 Tax=Microbulbifer mangrovi TaxID=927787 RepID=UPI00117EC856|nr:sulfotransferase [Microbulbifer mangrovi]